MTTTHLPDSVEHLATDLLIPYARNSRTHSPAQVQQLAASIREFGFTNPVLIDGDNTIIAGHGRVMAAQHLQLAQVPCIRLLHLNDAQRRAYVIADNKLAEQAGWDAATLAREIEDLQDIGFDLDLIGFTPAELDAIHQHTTLPSADQARALENTAAAGPATTSEADFKREMANQDTRGILPIVPQYAEHHEAFIVCCDNDIDEAWLRNRLDLQTPHQSYKDQKIRPANIITIAQLRKALAQ